MPTSKKQISKKLTSSFAFRVTDEERDFIIDYCEKADLSVSQCARRAIKEYLKNHPVEDEEV